jgi:hypothetical protein
VNQSSSQPDLNLNHCTDRSGLAQAAGRVIQVTGTFQDQIHYNSDAESQASKRHLNPSSNNNRPRPSTEFWRSARLGRGNLNHHDSVITASGIRVLTVKIKMGPGEFAAGRLSNSGL